MYLIYSDGLDVSSPVDTEQNILSCRANTTHVSKVGHRYYCSFCIITILILVICNLHCCEISVKPGFVHVFAHLETLDAMHARQLAQPPCRCTDEPIRWTHREITEILKSLLSDVEQKIMCKPVIPSWMERRAK